jgi:hypothetical protein
MKPARVYRSTMSGFTAMPQRPKLLPVGLRTLKVDYLFAFKKLKKNSKNQYEKLFPNIF